MRFLTTLVCLFLCLSHVEAANGSASGFEKRADGILIPVGNTYLKVQVCSPSIVRVACSHDMGFFNHPSLAVLPEKKAFDGWHVKREGGSAVITTSKLQVRVDLATGRVSFLTADGRPILAEKRDSRVLKPATVQGVNTYHVRQEWAASADESLYGLGQNQLDLLNIKGYDLDLWQHNGTVVIPFVVSSRGYGILWDNDSYSRFGDLRPFVPIPANLISDTDGKPGAFSASFYAGSKLENPVQQTREAKIDVYGKKTDKAPNAVVSDELPSDGKVSARWEGTLHPNVSGNYQLRTYSNGRIRLWINGKQLVNRWRQDWLPWYDLVRVHMEAGKSYKIRVEWTSVKSPDVVRLAWKTPDPNEDTSLWSEVGKGTDYYFVYGPNLDKVVAGYRTLTGRAPMMPKWAFGLWQSRQRYKTQAQIEGVVKGFRERKIPFDNIVQDWFYWKEDQWGSHEFDPKRFPDPKEMIAAIHDKYHAHYMISVWPKFYPGNPNFAAMQKNGFLYERTLKEGIKDWVGYPYAFYDAFNPAARKLYWAQIDKHLFKLGVDAWWLDASEPDLTPVPTLKGQHDYMTPTALGPGSKVLNAFALENAKAVYKGQRRAAPNQRVFILTRSGFAGQQRYAAATWSGDTSSSWGALKAQIPAGLGFCLSGVPYWTMDIGGFSVPERYSVDTPTAAATDEWRELNTRWFEFGTFVPLLRVHGEKPFREMWHFGGDSSSTYKAELKFDRIRYRLLPYIYSLAAGVTEHGGTIMRPLVMDFRQDARARDISDQYMFGPAILVNPVVVYEARSRQVYLPKAAGWYDFWTGKTEPAGTEISAPAPYDEIPLYVRAGSILPLGPVKQYALQKSDAPTTLVVYAGADGHFTLYDDDGLSFAYQNGACSRIPIKWNDASRTLTIGEREGSYKGMSATRTFSVVLVDKDKAIGYSDSMSTDRTIRYEGKPVTVSLP